MAKKKLSAFEKAFADARGKKMKVFDFKGKSYHTKTKEEMGGGTKKAVATPKKPKMDKKVPIPTPRPSTGAAKAAPKGKAQPSRPVTQTPKRGPKVDSGYNVWDPTGHVRQRMYGKDR